MRMKMFIMMLLVAVSLFGAQAVTTKYKVKLSLFGKVGEAKITIARRGDEYRMIVEDYATGLAAKISGNERDRMVSRGRIVNGHYVSDRFELFQTNDSTIEANIYAFDHDAKTITRYQDKNETVKETTFDIASMGLKEVKSVKKTKKTKVLDYYTSYDALSVVLNFPKLLEKGCRVEIKPVGLAKKERKMYISRPKGEALSEALEAFNYPGVRSVVQLDSYELKDDDEYGVLIGFNAHGGIDEVVTKETYFLIGYGRIEKIDEVQVDVDEVFAQ